MDFKQFKKALQINLANMVKNTNILFVSSVDKDLLWNTYLDSFPEGTNGIYRERREHDCSCCRSFIKNFGNVVAIKDNKIVSIWDFNVDCNTYGPVVKALSKLIREYVVQDVFVTKVLSYGTDRSNELLPSGTVKTWEHFFITLPDSFCTRSSDTIGSILGNLRSSKEVFKRSLEEITQDSLETVLELIAQKSLYKGEEWQKPLKEFLSMVKEYLKLDPLLRDNYCWAKSVTIGGALSRIKNHSIGVLLSDISEGMDLDAAVRRYESIVAPTNYKRPKAIFTKAMVESAQRKLEELGLLNSLRRRLATLDDITVNNILFANRDAGKRIAGSVFDELKEDANKTTPKTFEKVEQVSIEDFVSKILPNATSVEAFVENTHEGNLVSLIAPEVKDSSTMFKWGNNFSWAYKGNITDSMKERVKAAGGKVDGVLRFSIQWNENGDNSNDFDAHCIEPRGNRIYFGKARGHRSSGMLDVDIIRPLPTQVAVENITYTDLSKMYEGIYQFDVHTYSYRGGKSGFRAELEFDGQVYSYDYARDVRPNENVPVVTVRYSKKEGFSIVNAMESKVSSKEVWRLKTNRFHPVSVCMFSPNYWDGNKGIGHKHYFFMLDGCVNDSTPNGFFNEFLKEDLNPHRKVFEALGTKMRVAETKDQLSGLGFSSTKRASLICKVNGAFSRILKVQF